MAKPLGLIKMKYTYTILFILLIFFSCSEKSKQTVSTIPDISYQIKSAKISQFNFTDSSEIKTVKNYNSFGDLVEKTSLDINGKIINQTIIEYFSYNHPQKIIVLDDLMDTIYQKLYTYNSDSSIVTITNFFNGEPSVVYYLYKDNLQNTIYQAGYDNGSLLDTLANKYDKNYNRIKQLDFTTNSIYKFGYDTENRMISKTVIEMNTKEIKESFNYEYEVDSIGNWISMKEINSTGNQRKIIKRKLDYYK